MSKKVCFVLGSGGSRGIAHIGFLQAMEENGIKPDCITGCSMGALVGACYASGLSPLELKGVAESLKFSDIADFELLPLSRKCILRSNKMRNKITSFIKVKTFEELEIPFACVATDVISGKAVTFKEGNLAEAVIASSSIPLIFKAVEKDGMELVDGGVLERVPVRLAKEFGAEVTVAVDVLASKNEKSVTKNAFDLVARVVDINDANLTKRYLRTHKPSLYIVPELGNMSQYKVENLKFAYEQGYKAGIENVKKIKELIK